MISRPVEIIQKDNRYVARRTRWASMATVDFEELVRQAGFQWDALRQEWWTSDPRVLQQIAPHRRPPRRPQASVMAGIKVLEQCGRFVARFRFSIEAENRIRAAGFFWDSRK